MTQSPFARPHTLLAAAALCSVWIWVMLPSYYYWDPSSYYNYGWAVPFLGLFFVLRRFSNVEISLKESPNIKQRMFVFGVSTIFITCIFIVAKLFNEANPFWRVPIWGMGMLCLSLCILWILTFSRIKTLWLFLFPLLFLLTALPWPWRIEQWVIQVLTQWVTQLTVTAVNIIGYPAISIGSTIQVAEHHVGVDEACSGIRSLQTLFMLALFFGEFMKFGIIRRASLIIIAILLSMLLNGIRAVALTMVTIKSDASAFQFWHDFLGNFNAVICSILLFLCAEVLTGFGKKEKLEKNTVPWILNPKLTIVSISLMAGSLLIAEGLVSAYYISKESAVEPLPQLKIEWESSEQIQYSVEEIPERTAELLKSEFGEQVNIEWNSGLKAVAYHYGYSGDDKMASVSSFGHSPDICMTAIGANLRSRKDNVLLEIYGYKWPAQHLDFVFQNSDNPRTVQVFWLVWESQQMGVSGEELGSMTLRNQWNLVKSGRRNFGRQVLLVYFIGNHPEKVTRRKFKELLNDIIPE